MSYNKAWHAKNRTRLEAAKMERRGRNAAIVALARIGGCTRCSEDDPRCIDLHHVGTKQFALGSTEALDCTVERLQAEIRACVRMCSNCHRKEHRDV